MGYMLVWVAVAAVPLAFAFLVGRFSGLDTKVSTCFGAGAGVVAGGTQDGAWKISPALWGGASPAPAGRIRSPRWLGRGCGQTSLFPSLGRRLDAARHHVTLAVCPGGPGVRELGCGSLGRFHANGSGLIVDGAQRGVATSFVVGEADDVVAPVRLSAVFRS